jgi:phosphocarrier protein
MSGSLKQTVRIVNPHGFHMRPMANFARLAGKFKSRVTLTWADQTSDGKSMFDLMLLAAPQGSEMIIEVSGPDEQEAIEALVKVLLDPGEPDSPPGGAARQSNFQKKEPPRSPVSRRGTPSCEEGSPFNLGFGQ